MKTQAAGEHAGRWKVGAPNTGLFLRHVCDTMSTVGVFEEKVCLWKRLEVDVTLFSEEQ